MSDPAAGGDIDLYADVEEFGTEDSSLMAGDTSGDLYDDVLASSTSADLVKEEAKLLKKEETHDSAAAASGTASAAHLAGRRYQVYVGNLTWWTTDQDITDAVQDAGVADFIEVKFYENRANGQSKGFCCVSVGSEASLRLLMEKIPKKEMHGQTPVVTYATKAALIQFESQSKTRPPPAPPAGPMGAGRGMGGPPRPGIPGRGPPMGRGGPPAYSRPPPGVRPPPMHHHRGPPHMSGPPPIISGPPPISSHPPIGRGPPPGLPPGPAPHVNPAFFPQSSGAPGYAPAPHGLSEAEFEEIMSRNRTVSSSAITRAVQDAANGEYASAIETLVTAISLIKQSKVAGDDRCRILISSLQDTLHGIENKSYGARRGRSRSPRDRHRPPPPPAGMRRRSYSREREYRDRPPRDYYRGERSRSPRDHHRGHPPHHDRERERHYYEEQRYKDREREYRERERGPGGESSRRRDHERERRSGEGERRESSREKERPRH